MLVQVCDMNLLDYVTLYLQRRFCLQTTIWYCCPPGHYECPHGFLQPPVGHLDRGTTFEILCG